MRADFWLKKSVAEFTQAGITTARLDALVLLEDAIGHERSWILAHPEFELSSQQQAALQKVLTRRLAHEPLAYIRGHTEFYGRNFLVTSAVLEPRPESEAMIELLKKLPVLGAYGTNAANTSEEMPKMKQSEAPKIRIADVGAGSGALGITAYLELNNASVDLLEISDDAIAIAKSNVDLLTTGMLVIKSDLLAGSTKDYDILLCNLPYVPDSHEINDAAKHEPGIAIFGGADGLDLYRKLFEQIRNMQKQPLYILTESLLSQHDTLATIASSNRYTLHKTDNLIQLFKYS